MRFKRLITNRIKSLVEQFPATVLTGPRQAGKTTLLKSLFPEWNYVSLDSFQNAELAENQPSAFLARFAPPVIIDEVQYAPKLFRHLKIEIDKERKRKGQFILTGSQKFTLMKEVSDSLAGRVALLELEGLACEELDSALSEVLRERSAEYALFRGMFPELWEDHSISATDFYRSYLATYIERDVRQILNINSLRDFDRFMRAAASRNAQLLNKTELAKDVGVTAKTINDWLSVLEASNQITLLEPYFGNIGKRIVKSPRLFFNDTGLLCFLLGLSEAALKTYSGIGFIWESFVYAELRKLIAAREEAMKLWFYRDGAGTEVDLLLEKDAMFSLIEVKWTELPKSSDEKNLLYLSGLLKKKIRNKYIISRSELPTVTSEGTTVINGFKLNLSDILTDSLSR